jgi:hypothetical protein
MWWYSRYSASSPVPLVMCTSDLPGAYAVRRNRHPFALHSGHITEPWPLRFGRYSSGLITTGTSKEDVVGLHPSDHNIWGQEPGPSCSPGGRTRYPCQPSAGRTSRWAADERGRVAGGAPRGPRPPDRSRDRRHQRRDPAARPRLRGQRYVGRCDARPPADHYRIATCCRRPPRE